MKQQPLQEENAIDMLAGLLEAYDCQKIYGTNQPPNKRQSLQDEGAAIYRDLTGGLTDSSEFDAVYEVHGMGAPPYLGEEISLELLEGNMRGCVIDCSMNGAKWCALVDPRESLQD